MAETNEKERAEGEPTASSAPAQARSEDAELTDEQLDKVAGGFQTASTVLKERHDAAMNAIGNIR